MMHSFCVYLSLIPLLFEVTYCGSTELKTRSFRAASKSTHDTFERLRSKFKSTLTTATGSVGVANRIPIRVTNDYDLPNVSENTERAVRESPLPQINSNASKNQRYPRGFGDNLKNMWKKMRGKQSGSVAWDLSREEASEVYQEYYRCITKSYKEAMRIQKGQQKPVHAVMALEGERVTLKCSVCSRPDRDRLSQQAIWQHVRRSDSSLGSLVGRNKRVKQAPQGSLTLHDLQLEDAGQYTCLTSAGEFLVIYQVDVKIRERRKMIKEGSPLLNVTVLADHNLQLMTTWSKWGSCDACGVIGSRKRQGTCVVKKVNVTDPVKPKDFPLLPLYPEGVPCHSTALPPRIRLLKDVRRRYEETLLGTCNLTCPTEAPPVIVTDKDGKQVEVMPPGKFYDIHEKPPIPKMVKRRVIFEPEGKHLILQCSDMERDSGVRWMRGKRRVDPLSIKRQTAGRVWLDSANRLHIGLLLPSDTAVYNCWERQRHVVAIKVLVVDSFNEEMKNYITYGGFIVTILASLIACCCICGGGKKKAAAK